MTEKAIQQLCNEFFESIGFATMQHFCEAHKEEVAREYHIMLLQAPEVLHYTESVLRQLALLYLWKKKNGGDDWWKRPQTPRPEPPAPQGNGVRKVLEPA